MLTKLTSIVVAAVALGAFAPRCRAGEVVIDLIPVLEKVRAEYGTPGMAAAAVRDGRIVAQGAVGVRALGAPDPVRSDDRFLIGSCAKSMLRVLVARLVDAGMVSFETTLGQALGDVPMREEYRGVTIGQILAHKGGIPPYTRIGPKITPWLFDLSGTQVEQRAAFVAHVLNEPPAGKAGVDEVYSNAGYGIVAHVAERLAGKPWEDLVREQIFVPLGMTSAIVGYPTTPENPNDGPRGHFRGDNGFELTPGPRKPLAPFSPAGMISMNAADFARFEGELALIEDGKAGSYLSQASAARLTEIGPGGPKEEGVPFLGGEGTFTAAFAIWPSHDLAIVVETNGGGSDEVCQRALEAVRAEAAADVPAFVELPPKDRTK